MGLREDLLSITNRPYQPVFTARLNTPSREKRSKHLGLERARPQTCPKPNTTSLACSTQPTTSRATTAILMTTYKPVASRGASASTRKNTFLKPNDTLDNKDDGFDNVSEVSTNISLLSMESNKTLPELKSYGSFKYFSHFERYMNRRAIVKIPSHLMPK